MRRKRDELHESARSALGTLRWLPGLLAAFALALSPGAALAQIDLDEEIAEDDFSDLEGAGQSEDEESGGFDAKHWFLNVPVDLLVLRPYGFVDTTVGASFLVGVVPLIALSYSLPKLAYDGIKDGEWGWDWGFGNEAYERLVGDPWSYVWDRPLGQLQQ